MQKYKKVIRYIIYAVAAGVIVWLSLPVLFIAGLFIQMWLNTAHMSSQSFDREAWLKPVAESESYACYRGGMSDDISDNQIKPNMMRTDVYALLGNPDRTDSYQDEYYLGFCSGLRIDMDGLVVDYNRDGKVIKAYRVQH